MSEESNAGNGVAEKWHPATTAEYADYIVNRIKNGGKIRAHTRYDLGTPASGVMIATDRIWNLEGLKDGTNIIVPREFVTGGTHPPEGSNSKCLFMDSGKCRTSRDSDWWGPRDPSMVLYKDTVAELKKRGYSLRYLKKSFNKPATKWEKKDVRKERKELKKAFSAAPRASIKAKLARKIPGLR